MTGPTGAKGDQGITGATGETGERGPVGDHGKDGQRGQTGQAGIIGLTGFGERGPTGDHGQDGETGLTGATGRQGEPGSDVRALKVNDRRLMFLFVLMLIVFGVLSWRTQTNQNAIRHVQHQQAVLAWEQCQRSATNTAKINSTNDAFVQFLQGVTRTDTPQLGAFIKIYQDAKLAVPVCGPRP